MKKFLSFLFCLLLTLSSFSLYSCNKKEDLSEKVSYLRQIEYQGKSDNYSLRAFYGFRETPFNNDGVGKDKVYGISFRLLDKELDQSAYTISLS